MILAVLMLLPMIASMAFAVSPDDIVVTDEPQNIAHIGEFSTASGLAWTDMELDALIDGDKEYGSVSPKGRESAIRLNLGKEFYISKVVVVANGKGEANGDEYEEVVYDTVAIKVNGYSKKGALVFESLVYDTHELEEVSIEIDNDVQNIEICIEPVENPNSPSSSYCTLWEVEAYTQTAPLRCNAEQENIASTALLNSTVYNGTLKENVSSSWWAMDLSRIIDGDIHTGSHTVKSSAFSLWFYFGQEKRMSEVIVHTNGNGSLSPATGLTTAGFKDAQDQPLGPGVNYFNSYEITIVLYDFNDEIVYQSEVVDVSTLTEFSAQAGVEAATVEVKISNAGGAGQGGGIYIWDVEIYEEKGDHIFEQIDQEAPKCGIPGYRTFKCLDTTCEMTKVETLASTGYHTWNDGAIANDPTETENGTRVLTCTVCGSTTNRDEPAIGHNWDNGTVIAPDCEDGYTEYKCTDAGCNLSYKADFVLGIGHKYDDGVLTRKSTVEVAGQMKYTCLRENCGYELVKDLRNAKYIDTTFKVDNSIVDKIIATDNQEIADNIFDGLYNDEFWCAPGGFKEVKDEDGKTVQVRNSGKLEIILNNTYYFTKGTIFVASNWNWMEVHFMYQDESGEWQTSASYVHDRVQTDGSTPLDMTPSLNQGARATKIVVEAVGAIGGSDPDHPVKTHWQIPEYQGSGLRFYEISLEAHKCQLQPEDYEPRENWIMPTCSKAGSCKATCSVCNAVSTVELDPKTYAHPNCSEVNVIEEPTCLRPGVGTKVCNDCSATIEVEVPATGAHDYSKDYEFIPPECSTVGLGQRICSVCSDVSYQYPIEPTGLHKDGWVTKSHANYTAVGVDRYACVYCGRQGNEEDIITEKLAIPENFVTFKGYSIRMTNYVGIRASFQFDQEILDTLEETCDVTITIYAKNVSTGKVVSAQAYGKSVHYSGTEKFNENNEFSAVAKVTDCSAEYEFSYEIKLINFRGTETKTVTVPGYTNGKTTTNVKEIAAVMVKDNSLRSDIKKFLNEVIGE